MVSYDHVQYQKKKLITQSWENLVTDGWADGQSDFIGRYPSNVEYPKRFMM